MKTHLIQYGQIFTLLSLLVMGGATSTRAAAFGDFYVNGGFSVGTDYVWRGRTQTREKAAVSAETELGWKQGFYLGAWASNVDFNGSGDYEIDYYAGYRNKSGGFKYDVGIIAYTYPDRPNDHEAEYGEIYVRFGGGPVSLSIYSLAYSDAENTSFGDDAYVSFDINFDLPLGFGIGAHAGYFKKNTSESYADYAVWISAFGFRATYTDTNLNAITMPNPTGPNPTGATPITIPNIDSEPRFILAYHISF